MLAIPNIPTCEAARIMKITLLLAIFLLGVCVLHGDDVPIAKVLNQVGKGKPQVASFVIAWKKVEGLQGDTHFWTIEGTRAWVKLYPEARAIKDEHMDRKKRYRVEGVLLEQWYGVYQVWVYEISEAKNSP